MAVTLGHNQYGKAETRVVRVFRDTEPHEIVDYNVSVALVGDFADVHLHRRQHASASPPTPPRTPSTPSRRRPATPSASRSRSASRWRSTSSTTFRRCPACASSSRPTRGTGCSHDGSPHPHAFARRGAYVRTVTVTYDGRELWVVSGVRDLVVLKTTDSEFHTFYAGALHDAAADERPGHGHVGDRAVAAHRHRHRLGHLLRPGARHAEQHLRRPPQPRAAADDVRDGRGHHRRAAGDRGDPLLAAEQAPLRRSTSARSAWRTRTRSSTPTTGPTATSRAPSAATTPRTPAPAAFDPGQGW